MRDAAARRRERGQLIEQREAAQGWAVEYIDTIFAEQSKNRRWYSVKQLKKQFAMDRKLDWSKRMAALDELQRRVDELDADSEPNRQSLYRPDVPAPEVEAKLRRTEEIAGLLPDNDNLKQLGGAAVSRRPL